MHGKFGLVMIVLALIHIIKRRKWYNGRKSGTYFIPLIDADKCENCKRCVKHCPANVLVSNGQCVVVAQPKYCFD